MKDWGPIVFIIYVLLASAILWTVGHLTTPTRKASIHYVQSGPTG